MTTLINNIRLAGQPEPTSWILIDGDRIAAVGDSEAAPGADCVVNGDGALAMPGAIDCHVHFREPGMTDKADIRSESRAAIAGGVTSYLEMPNTRPATTTIETWQQKMDIAAEGSAANYAFFIGATNDNIDVLKSADYTRIPGVKLFMGSSTGNMLVDDESTIARIFKEVEALVAVHAENQGIIDRNLAALNPDSLDDLPVEMHSRIRSVQACYESTRHAVEIARMCNHRLHICHLTTEAELSLLQPGDPAGKLITSEVSPHHLMWCDDDYLRLGTRIKMNPAVKSADDRQALRTALCDGLIDMVATDHAPHLLSQKQGGALKAVSGAPLVQFSLPWMLTHFDEDMVQRTMCLNPARVYGIDGRGSLTPGYYADIVLIDCHQQYSVTDDDVLSKCRWTPLSGLLLTHSVRQTWVNGRCAYSDGRVLDTGAAMPLRFSRG